MSDLSLLALSPRTACFLFAGIEAKYRLPQGETWQLHSEDGSLLSTGSSQTAALYFTGLEPDEAYRLTVSNTCATFKTARCAGALRITDLGADDNAPDNTAAIQSAIDRVPTGGSLIVPRGRFVTGPLFLKSHMTLHLETGAELALKADWTDWPILPARNAQGLVVGTWEGEPAESFAALINAVGASHLAITGQGILDGGGDRGDWWTWPKETRRGARRPRTVFLAYCDHVEISGCTIRNSPSWTVHPMRCRDLKAVSLKIENPPDSPNTDGFNPESCEDVSLIGLHFSVGDDCIAIKSGKRTGHDDTHLAPTRNVLISNCLMERGHGAVVLGSEMSGDITDIKIQKCQFVGTDRGLRIKTRRGRGGKIARISMSDVVMDGVDTAFSANGFYFCDADGQSEAVQSRSPAPRGTGTPSVEGVTLRNILAENVRLAAVALLGLPEAPFRDIHLDGFDVTFDPLAEAGIPLMACGVPACRHEGIWADFAQVNGGISMHSKDGIHAL
ncbi:polygalacturonase [Roseibium aquae]|uniref:Polygalacturonase n=1 Tax=Roseibium aquae TaxID=1323746 RepID=A0A916X087_9HYPH|nr:glycoside hydrolase family 28 protein [Roseibium aquae]GGB46739.1 polygalacturonase [Roseibium aquae]